MRKDVETYEDAVRKRAALAEQARLKEQAAKERQNPSNPSQFKRTNLKSECMASVKGTVETSFR